MTNSKRYGAFLIEEGSPHIGREGVLSGRELKVGDHAVLVDGEPESATYAPANLTLSSDEEDTLGTNYLTSESGMRYSVQTVGPYGDTRLHQIVNENGFAVFPKTVADQISVNHDRLDADEKALAAIKPQNHDDVLLSADNVIYGFERTRRYEESIEGELALLSGNLSSEERLVISTALREDARLVHAPPELREERYNQLTDQSHREWIEKSGMRDSIDLIADFERPLLVSKRTGVAPVDMEVLKQYSPSDIDTSRDNYTSEYLTDPYFVDGEYLVNGKNRPLGTRFGDDKQITVGFEVQRETAFDGEMAIESNQIIRPGDTIVLIEGAPELYKYAPPDFSLSQKEESSLQTTSSDGLRIETYDSEGEIRIRRITTDHDDPYDKRLLWPRSREEQTGFDPENSESPHTFDTHEQATEYAVEIGKFSQATLSTLDSSTALIEGDRDFSREEKFALNRAARMSAGAISEPEARLQQIQDETLGEDLLRKAREKGVFSPIESANEAAQDTVFDDWSRYFNDPEMVIELENEL